ncbi:MAG: hypothetical protein Q9207_003097 [Kuettlingeria erythrocarpa]
MTCKASWRRVFDEVLSLQMFWTLHGLKPEKEKDGFYHRLVDPSTGSMGEIQRATDFGVSRDKGRISDTTRTVFSNRTGIYHHIKALLVCWILLLSGRWFRKLEHTDNILRRSITHFRFPMAELGQPLERLCRRGRGLYQRPTMEWGGISTMIDSSVRLHKPVVPLLQPDGSPVYLSVRGDGRNAFSSTKRLRQSSWPKTAFFQSGAPMKASQHSVSVARPKATTLHTSSAAHFKVSASTEHSRPRPYLSLKPARKKEEKNSLSDGPDYERMRTIWGSVLSSLDGLIDALREPMDRGVDCASSRPLLLYAPEFSRLRRELDGDCYEARLYVRLREDWQSILNGSKAGYDSLRLAVLDRLRQREERLAERLFCQSLDRLYGGYLQLEQFRRLYALCSLTEQKKLYSGIVGPMINTDNQLRLMIFRGLKMQDEAIYPFRQFQKSFSLLVHRMHELVDGWLEPWGDYKLESMIDRDVLEMHVIQLRRSGKELKIVLAPLCVELRKACRPSKRLDVRCSRPGQYVLRPESGNPSQPPAPRNSLPSYLAEDGKDRKGGIDGLKRTPWARFPLRSTTHLLKSSSVASTSSKQAAPFHSSATTRHPATSPAAEIGIGDLLEEETHQVNRGNETLEPPVSSPRGYHIPSAKQRECMQASTATRSAYWQYSLYQGPKGERVKVHYCKSRETTERISKLFLNEKVIGFDIEWKPLASAKDGIRKNVAMIQLASEDRIALFHLARFSKGDTIEDLLAPSLKRIMESGAITKVGVSIKSDCTRLRKYLNLDCRGLFELSHLYKLVKHADQDVKKINKKLVSLAAQTEEHLKLPMYKDQSVRSSDWSGELNYEQIYYAASDSYAGFQLYYILNHKRQSIFPTPPLPAHADLNLPIRLANGQTVAEYEDPNAEEPPPEPSDDVLFPVGQLVEDVMNLRLEDRPPPPITPRPKPKPNAASLSSHPSIVAANAWIARYLASSTPSVTDSNDLSYPLLPPMSSSTSPFPRSTDVSISSPMSSNPSTQTPPSTFRPRPTPTPLRAYFLFHHHRLSIPDIASLLRQPPLQHATVAGYVLDSVRFQNLALETARAEECLECVGEAGRGRYRGLVRRLEGTDVI